jgi:hypothetical protein
LTIEEKRIAFWLGGLLTKGAVWKITNKKWDFKIQFCIDVGIGIHGKGKDKAEVRRGRQI